MEKQQLSQTQGEKLSPLEEDLVVVEVVMVMEVVVGLVEVAKVQLEDTMEVMVRLDYMYILVVKDNMSHYLQLMESV